VESQRQHEDFDYIELEVNHYEVLMDPETVQIIRNRMQQAQLINQIRSKKS
jgi:hypothetical protein